MKSYCTQNEGDCTTCSLVNYNRDCHNNPIKKNQRAVAVRLDPDTHKRFSIKLIQDEMSAQEFFSNQVKKYLIDIIAKEV